MEKFYRVFGNDLITALNMATYDELGRWLRGDCANLKMYTKLAKGYFPSFPEEIISMAYDSIRDLWEDNEMMGYNNPDGSFKGGVKVTEKTITKEPADMVNVSSDIVDECFEFFVDGGFSYGIPDEIEGMSIEDLMNSIAEKETDGPNIDEWINMNPGKIEEVIASTYHCDRFDSVEELVNYCICQQYKNYLVDNEEDLAVLIASLFLLNVFGVKKISRKIWDDDIAEKVIDIVHGWVDYSTDDIKHVVEESLITHGITYAAV